MTKEYPNGAAFLAEHTDFLNQNPYLSTLFFVDAKVLQTADEKNYAVATVAEGKTLLAIKVEPYNLLFYGAAEPLEETLRFLAEKKYEFDGILCPTEVGDRLIEIASAAVGRRYTRSVGLDFMEAVAVTEPSAPGVTVPTAADLDQLFENTVHFIRDCGLSDPVRRENIAKMLSSFRVFKEGEKIVSMARYTANDDRSDRISHVYTCPEYRGKGYARKVVNALKNEILARGKIATLNVDQANPVSNHLYESLGFKKLFSQGIYTVV